MRRLFLLTLAAGLSLLSLAATGCLNIKAPERISITGFSDDDHKKDDGKSGDSEPDADDRDHDDH